LSLAMASAPSASSRGGVHKGVSDLRHHSAGYPRQGGSRLRGRAALAPYRTSQLSSSPSAWFARTRRMMLFLALAVPTTGSEVPELTLAQLYNGEVVISSPDYAGQ